MFEQPPDGERIAALETEVRNLVRVVQHMSEKMDELSNRSIAIGAGGALLWKVGIAALTLGGWVLAWKTLILGGGAH